MTAVPVDPTVDGLRPADSGRSEIQVAADTVLRLAMAGMFRADVQVRAICAAAGISSSSLTYARARTTARHYDQVVAPGRRKASILDGVSAYAADNEWRPKARRADGRQNTTASTVRADGTKWCPGCESWLPLIEFDRRDASGRPKSRCRPCARDYQRRRYLHLSRQKALAVGEFVLRAADDDVVGTACARCGDPFCEGQPVVLLGSLLHAACRRTKGTP